MGPVIFSRTEFIDDKVDNTFIERVLLPVKKG
jgi:hypothetical protein